MPIFRPVRLKQAFAGAWHALRYEGRGIRWYFGPRPRYALGVPHTTLWACHTLRFGRATRYALGVPHATLWACHTLRFGRATRYALGVRFFIACFPSVVASPQAAAIGPGFPTKRYEPDPVPLGGLLHTPASTFRVRCLLDRCSSHRRWNSTAH
jgi:hypothetical protein